MATLNDFVSKIRTGDLARSNRFEVEILSPGAIDSNDVNILCEDASVPGLIIPYVPIKIGNITEPRAHSMEFFGDNATFTFFCDTNWDVRSYFEEWMAATVDPVSREASFFDDCAGSINIFTLNRQDARVRGWGLIDCIPRNISLANFSQGNEAPIRVSVSMAYKKWVRLGDEDVGTNTPAESASQAPEAASRVSLPPKAPNTDSSRSFSNLSGQQTLKTRPSTRSPIAPGGF
jgi:hypothetical protein